MHAMSFTKKLEASLDSDMIKLCEIWYVCNQRCLLQACHEYQGSVTVVCAIILEIAKKNPGMLSGDFLMFQSMIFIQDDFSVSIFEPET